MTKLWIVGDYLHKKLDGSKDYSGIDGQNFNYLLQQAGIARSDAEIFNIFPIHPKKGEEWKLWSKKYGAFPEYKGYVDAFISRLSTVRPHCIVPLGGMVQGILLGSDKINEYRGTTVADARGLKILPTYHPDTAISDWSLRPFIVKDLEKAKAESAFPEIRRVNRKIYLVESVEDFRTWVFNTVRYGPPEMLSVDIETKNEQITSIALAWSPTETIQVPFRNQQYLPKELGGSPLCWSHEAEVELWKLLSLILTDPRSKKVFHNGPYDLRYLMKYGIFVRGDIHDTMFMAHSTQLEWPKSLGFLGSLYCQESAWKLLRNRSKEEGKSDE